MGKESYKRKSSIEKGNERHMLELDFRDMPENLKENIYIYTKGSNQKY